jgi:membrane protease YdiL (CAAX protease family)
MKSLQAHQRVMIFVLLVPVVACLISPWMALGADWFGARWPNVMSKRVPFPRVFNRAFMIGGILLFIVGHRLLIPGRLKRVLGVTFADGWRSLLVGYGLALGSMVLLVVVMTVADVYTPSFHLSLQRTLSRVARAFAAGMFTGLFEEIFFRALLFLSLREQGRPLGAYILANLFYSLLHFVKPGQRYYLDQIDPLAGFRHLFTTFGAFLDPLPLLPGIFGLFLVGVVLSYALARTGKLYLSIGLHAGWITSLQTMRVFDKTTRSEFGWAFGSADPKIVSGVVTWIGILLVGVVVHWLTRREARFLTDRTDRAAA